MRYVNNLNPNRRILIKRGPDLPKGENQNARQDKFVEFRFGFCETDDPEAIAVLDARSDCIREENINKREGYIQASELEGLIQKRIDEMGLRETAKPEPRKVPDYKVAPRTCDVCGKVVQGALALSGHMRSHKAKAAA